MFLQNKIKKNILYKIVKGDSLDRIANRYGLTASFLEEISIIILETLPLKKQSWDIKTSLTTIMKWTTALCHLIVWMD